MGYESRIIIAEVGEYDLRSGSKEKYCIKLGQMWLSECGYFKNIFTIPIDFELLGDGFEENSRKEYNMTEDCYGDTCCYTDLQTVIDYLENQEANDHYRRFAVALAMLKAFQAEQWDKPIIVIHYGY